MSLRARGKKFYEKILFGFQSWLFHHDSNSWHNAKCWIKATFQLPKSKIILFQPYTADQSGKICTHGWKNAFKSVKLPSLKVICWKVVKMKPRKLCMEGGGVWYEQTAVKCCDFVEQYLHTLWSYHFKLEKFSNSGHSFLSSSVDGYLLGSLYKKFTKTVKGTIALLGHAFEVATLFCKVPGHFLWQIPP